MPVQKRVSSTVPIFCLKEPSDQIRSTVIGSEFLLEFTFQPLSQKHSNLLVLKRTAFKCASRQLYPKIVGTMQIIFGGWFGVSHKRSRQYHTFKCA
jgi:hypothetical protein